MEPRPEGLGNLLEAAGMTLEDGLQWSRGPKASETHSSGTNSRKGIDASMEPRPEGLGNLSTGTRWRMTIPRFNGAEARRPRKRSVRLRDVGCYRCFNGAEARRPRKPDMNQSSGRQKQMLQWSRGPKASETSIPDCRVDEVF